MQVLSLKKIPETDFAVKIVFVALYGIWHNDESDGVRGYGDAQAASKEGSHMTFAETYRLTESVGDWDGVTTTFFASSEGKSLLAALEKRLATGEVIYPPDPFKALRMTPLEKVRVVILGQDPYHGEGEAVGMAFSVPAGRRKLPPSLRNIFKEIAREYGTGVCESGDLSAWAMEGVLLLNTVLTVAKDSAGSHGKLGWQKLTDNLIAAVAARSEPHVFLLWGRWAHQKEELIRKKAAGPVLILKSNHPSPLSAMRPPEPFLGNGHFQRANEWLKGQGEKTIGWNLVPAALF